LATLIDYICMAVMSTNECLITRRWFAEQIAKDENNCKNKQKLEQSKEPITFYVITPANHFPPHSLFFDKYGLPHKQILFSAEAEPAADNGCELYYNA